MHSETATASRIGRRTTPPFRADHVGSLLRPPELLQARDDAAAGKIDADRAARDRGRGDPRDRREAGGDRPPVRDGRRVPPRVVAHGLHLRARRHHEGSRPHRGQVPQREGRHRVHAGRAARRRQARRLEDDLRRRVRVPPRHRHDERPEADDPVAEHGPLPRRQGRDRPERVPGDGRVLGRPHGRVLARRCAGSASSAARTSSSTTRASRT